MAKIKRFADLHCHASFMSFLWKSKPKKTLRQRLISNAKNRFAIALTNSSSDINKLIDGDVKLISASLYAIERGFTQLSMVRFFLFFVTKIDGKKLRQIRRRKLGYFEQIKRNIAYIKKALRVNPKVQFRLLSEKNDFLEDDKVNVVLSIEGSHALFSNVANDLSKQDELWSNLAFLKSDTTVRIFYLTLVHIQQTPISNHAFGIPQKALRHRDFVPIGDGISTLGFELIARCLSSDNGKPIYIDIKHMSIKARLQFYDWLKVNNLNIPIIASHMGVTGRSIAANPVKQIELKKDWVEVEYQEIRSEFGVKFNNWSINLFDEEIVEILNSDGIIGISLDAGILGASKHQKELFSKSELTWINENLVFQCDYKESGERSDVSDIEYFINNLFHILKVAKQFGLVNAHHQLCIGSDFDGLIAPIKECQNATMFESFEGKLYIRMVELKELYPDILDFEISDFLEGFFYSNYKNFMLKYL